MFVLQQVLKEANKIQFVLGMHVNFYEIRIWVGCKTLVGHRLNIYSTGSYFDEASIRWEAFFDGVLFGSF